MTLLLEGTIQSSLILLVGLALAALLRGRPAAQRHAVLALALGCAAVAPLLGRAVPSWQLPATMSAWAGETAQPPASGAPAVIERSASANPARADVPRTVRIVPALRAIWLAGVAFAVFVLAAGFLRLAVLAARARPAPAGRLTAAADAIAGEYRVSRPVALLLGAHPSLIVTWGVRRPKVMLPQAAADWPDERLRIVLYHELAHVRRGDWVVMLAAEALKCVYWFNPLVWVSCARLRQEGEQACDDEVINRGVEATVYARELVDIARDLTRGRPWVPAPAISRSSRFERRVQAMLDKQRNRAPVSRRVLATQAVLMLVMSIAIAAAQSGFASVTGSIVDPGSGVIPDVTLVLTNVANQAKYEVRTDRTGRYEFVAVPAGEYVFEAKRPGFAAFKGTLTVAGNVQRDLTLEVGSVQETITVAQSRSNPSAAGPPATEPARPRPPLPDCPSASAAGGPPIGGNIRAPMKLKHVRPVYSPVLAGQGIEGAVVLKGRIGTTGLIEDLEVVSTPHADLANAALEAVRQWEFTETLLNCKPIPVSIGIRMNFTLTP